MQLDISWFSACLNDKKLSKKLNSIKLVITDIDGSLTDGNIYLLDQDELKGFSTQDGLVIAHAIKTGLQVSFMSARNSNAVRKRALKLGIPENLCILDAPNGKKEIVSQIMKENKLVKEEVLFWGDDILDIEVKDLVGIFSCPSSAPFYIQHSSDLVIEKRAGEGAFRLLMDLLLYLQERHPAQKLVDLALGRAQ